MDSFLQLFQLFSGNIFLCIFALLFALAVIIGIHEFGHYAVARFFGVRIEKFSLGFGKEIAGFTDRRGTRWCISRIPLGGYIAIFGDLDPEHPEIYDPALQKKRPLTTDELHVAFYRKPVWQRMLIVAAGPVTNFIFTFIVLFILFAGKGQLSSPPIVTMVGTDTAAYEAGFRPFDKILSIDGRRVERFEDVWDWTYIKTGVPYTFKVERGGQIITLTAASRPTEYTDANGIRRSHGRMGATHIAGLELKDIDTINSVNVKDNPDKARKILLSNMDRDVMIGMFYDYDEEGRIYTYLAQPVPETNKGLSDPRDEDYNKVFFFGTKERLYYPLSPPRALQAAGKKTAEIVDEGIKILGVMFTGHAKKTPVGGVGTMGKAAGKAIQDSWYTFLLFMAVFSAQIGFINLFPIPVLDGGYLAFLSWEALRGKPLPENIRNTAFYLGLALLFGIMVIANLSDIFQMTRQ